MTQETQELAYHLWETAGRPYGQDREFWLKAEQQLTEQSWKVECGQFACQGFGVLTDVIKCALVSAKQEGKLAAVVTITSESGEVLIFDTITQLKKHGLYKSFKRERLALLK